MNKYEQYHIHLTEKQKHTVEEYLAKLKRFVTKHELDTELYTDIEEMVYEKLADEGHLTELKIAKILQDVGEPEVIFSDSVPNVLDDGWLFYEKLLATGWVRDNNNALVLGVSGMLSHKFGIPVWLVRVLFLLFLIPFGATIIIYTTLAIIFPKKGKDYSGLSVTQYLLTQIRSVIKDVFKNVWNTLTIGFVFLMRNTGKAVRYIIKHLGGVIRVIFFGILGLWMLSILIAVIVLVGVYFSDFSLYNVDFTAVFPEYFGYGLIIAALAFGIFAPLCFSWAFARKGFPLALVLIAWGSLLVSASLFVSTGLVIGQRYSQQHTATESVSQTVQAGSYKLDLSGIMDERNNFLSFDNDIELVKSPNNTFKAELISTVNGDKVVYDSFQAGIAKLVLKGENKNLALEFEGGQRFAKTVLPAPRTSRLVLSIPENVEIEFYRSSGRGYNYSIDAALSPEFQKYSDAYSDTRECREKIISYSPTLQKFVCKFTDEELAEAKKDYAIESARNQFDEIVTIKHSSRYRRNYYNDYSRDLSGWEIESIEIDEKNPNHLLLRFSDNNLQIEATVRYDDTVNAIQFSEFTLLDARITDEDSFQEDNYRDIGLLKEYLR